MIASLLVLLAEGVFTTVWECRLRPRPRTSDEILKRNLKVDIRPPTLIQQPPLSMDGAIPVGSTVVSQASCEVPSQIYSFQRESTSPPTYTIKWNRLTLARPPKSVRELMCQPPQQQQHPLFLDITDSTSGVNSPSTATHPPSDVV